MSWRSMITPISFAYRHFPFTSKLKSESSLIVIINENLVFYGSPRRHPAIKRTFRMPREDNNFK